MRFTSIIRRSAWVPALVVGVLIAMVAGSAVLLARGPAYEVRGDAAVPYDAGKVKEVRVLDSATVYVDGERKPGPSVIGGIALIVLATAAFMTAVALSFAHAGRRLVTFYVIVAAALGFAGLDELFAIHESVGHNLQFLADVPGVSRPDDLVIALYLVPAVLFAWLYRDVLRSDRRAATALAAGIAVFAMAAAADLAGIKAEEYLELVSGLCIGAGIARLIFVHLSRNLQIRVEAVDRPPGARAPAEPFIRAGALR
jgi:hypothetical protein